MRTILIILTISVFIISCSSTKQQTTTDNENITTTIENDGSSFEKAIVIKKDNSKEGINAEYEYLRKNYPEYKFMSQSLIFHNDKPYDVLTIITSDGIEKDVYFDISNFFGKY
jgi:predicted Zn-dependent protease